MQNAPIRTALTEAKGPSNSRSFLQPMNIQSQGKKVRAEPMHIFPCTLSQLLLGRGSPWSLYSVRVFQSINLLIWFSFTSSGIKGTKSFIMMVSKNAGMKFWLYFSQSLWRLCIKVLQFGAELQSLHHTTD